jgi:hypothetical protein
MSDSETGLDMWLEDWVERVDRSGLSVVVLPLLELGQAFGFLAGQGLLLIQPVLEPLIDKVTLTRSVTLLEEPALLEEFVERLERKAKAHD